MANIIKYVAKASGIGKVVCPNPYHRTVTMALETGDSIFTDVPMENPHLIESPITKREQEMLSKGDLRLGVVYADSHSAKERA